MRPFFSVVAFRRLEVVDWQATDSVATVDVVSSREEQNPEVSAPTPTGAQNSEEAFWNWREREKVEVNITGKIVEISFVLN